MTPPPDPSHGGARVGAGRKPGHGPFGEPTQPIRVPESEVPTVLAYLDARRKPATATHVRPVATSETMMQLLTFASRVPAGFPSPAEDYREELDLSQHLVIRGHEAATFIIRVSGWSMMGAGIFDGDECLVDRALTPRQGDIVVAIVNNELTIKRLGKIEGKVALLPENPHFKPITFEEGETLEVWGVVTRCLRNLR